MRTKYLTIMIAICMASFYSASAQTTVNSLAELITAVKKSNQTIVMTPGKYNMTDLPSNSRDIDCSGSNNIINLTGVYVKVPVGSVSTTYVNISGNNIVFRGAEFEDTYKNGMTEVTDFSAYNQDRTNLAKGLKGAAVLDVSGNDNRVVGVKLTVRGSHPYGYGSMYGIGKEKVFPLDKRCALLITGLRNTIDSTEVQQRAFGHGIYMQDDVNGTVIKNTLVEGRIRHYAELYDETESWDLPFRSDYVLPYEDNRPIPRDEVFSRSEDGIRSYGATGSVVVENCTVKQMRGGIRLYLASSAKVSNSTVIDCGTTNINMPAKATITNFSSNFAYSPLSDFRFDKSNVTLECTIIPSPHSTGPHNLIDLGGSNHKITFHRTPGPQDPSQRPIVVTGDNSTIINETEYPIILASTANENTIKSCGKVTDNGTNNTIISLACTYDSSARIEAENYNDAKGTKLETCKDIGGGENLGSIRNGNWLMYSNIDLSEANSLNLRVGTPKTGSTVEIRIDSFDGDLIGTSDIPVTGQWQKYETISVKLTKTLGVHDVYLVFRNANTDIGSINWLQFSASTPNAIKESSAMDIALHPNPVSDKLIITNCKGANIEVYNTTGSLITKSQSTNNIKILDMRSLNQGIYFVRIVNTNGSIKSYKVIKQ
ncbi:carbohydrate-binding protein [bacterium]|nr:carbohydrate-binding protein [bacterium]